MARLPLPDDVSPMACASLPGGASPSQPPDAACPAKPAGQSAAQAEPATAATAAQQATGLGNGLPAGRRRYLTCCARLSPEKEPHRFVELVEFLSRCDGMACISSSTERESTVRRTRHGQQPSMLSNHCSEQRAYRAASVAFSYRPVLFASGASFEHQNVGTGYLDSHVGPLCRAGALARLGVTPLLCGAATTPYAEAQRNGLRAAAPDAVVERRFLGPAELAQVRCNS